MNWKTIKSDLLYDYTRFLLKSLNNHELVFMKFLRDQNDMVINEWLSWTDDNLELLTSFDDSSGWLDYFYDESMIEQILVSLIGDLDNSLDNLVGRFYGTGARIGYNHMGKDYGFYDSDKRCLGNLQGYVNSVNKSIQGEVAYGGIQVIGEHIDNNDLTHLKESIVNLPYTSIDHHINPDTRILFTVKTEYARAVNSGLLQSYSNYGVDLYDWVTSGLPNTCNRCFEIENGSPYNLNEIIKLCPVHVNCVCSVKARLPKILSLQENPSIVDITPNRRG